MGRWGRADPRCSKTELCGRDAPSNSVGKGHKAAQHIFGVQHFWAGGWIFSGSSFFSAQILPLPSRSSVALTIPVLHVSTSSWAVTRVPPPPAWTWPGVCALQPFLGKDTAAAILTEAWATLWACGCGSKHCCLWLFGHLCLRAASCWERWTAGLLHPSVSAHPFIWLRGERRCWLYTWSAESSSEHDCHLKAFTRKLRQGASSCAQLQSDLLVVCSRREFFSSLRAKRQLFVKGGLQNVPNGSIQHMQQDAGSCCVPLLRLLGALLELSRGLLCVFLGNS